MTCAGFKIARYSLMFAPPTVALGASFCHDTRNSCDTPFSRGVCLVTPLQREGPRTVALIGDPCCHQRRVGLSPGGFSWNPEVGHRLLIARTWQEVSLPKLQPMIATVAPASADRNTAFRSTSYVNPQGVEEGGRSREGQIKGRDGQTKGGEYKRLGKKGW